MKRKFLAVLTSVICLAAAVPSASVLADGQKVLTLGADLDDQQRTAILNYFGVNGQNIQTLTITNQDERDHLGSYVPLEQIGTRTYSCALVSPTNSGGIQVKTANLSWVTSNMIAATLSTSGVVNCDVLAAAPFEVSGTGALTGILMAYESAVGETLDETKKEVATQELITTTTIANNIGQIEATEIVNESKVQVIQGDVISDNDIDVIINEVAADQNVSLTDEDRELLKDLLAQIAQQDYDYQEMKETLDRVETNMNELAAQQAAQNGSETPATETPAADAAETPETVAADSILNNTDDSALGTDAIITTTDTAEIVNASETEQQNDENTSTIEIVSSDSYSDTTSDNTDNTITIETPAEETPAETSAESDDQTLAEQQEEAGSDGSAVSEEGELDGGFDIGVPADESSEAASVTAPITVLDLAVAPATSEENGYTALNAGVNELTVYFQRSDIAVGSGSLTVTNTADGIVIDTVAMNDTSKVSIEPMTDEEILEQGWASGSYVKAVIALGTPLAQSSNYSVTLSEGAFVSTEDASVLSEAVADTSFWDIQTSEYGVALDRSAGFITAGSTISGQILMDGTAATYACIDNAGDVAAVFSQGEFTPDSESFDVTFGASGKISFQVSFYDADGNWLNTIDYTVTVK
jgi:uncharacterized protein YpuA (DUF1002 family)